MESEYECGFVAEQQPTGIVSHHQHALSIIVEQRYLLYVCVCESNNGLLLHKMSVVSSVKHISKQFPCDYYIRFWLCAEVLHIVVQTCTRQNP